MSNLKKHIVICLALQDGSSNYFKGLMLVLCYLIVAASFYVHVDPKPNGEFNSNRELIFTVPVG